MKNLKPCHHGKVFLIFDKAVYSNYLLLMYIIYVMFTKTGHFCV